MPLGIVHAHWFVQATLGTASGQVLFDRVAWNTGGFGDNLVTFQLHEGAAPDGS